MKILFQKRTEKCNAQLNVQDTRSFAHERAHSHTHAHTHANTHTLTHALNAEMLLHKKQRT